MVDSPQNNDPEIPLKKKRGRKPKPKPEVEEIKIPKKRGRKPKLKLITPEEKNKFVLPSKRGRKPKDKTIILDKNLNLDNISNVILHLPIPASKLEELEDEISFKYKPNLNNPNPYDPNSHTSGASTINKNIDNNCIYELVDQEKNDKNKIDKMCINEYEKNNISTDNINNINNINKNNINKNNVNENNISVIEDKVISYNSYINDYYNDNRNDKKNIKCNWCLHDCDDEPVRIPYNTHNEVFNMYGNFCCPECAAAFNFSELNDEYMWERYSLLNYMYNSDNEKYTIAPPRLVLDIFGGPLNIDEYRDIIKTKKKLNIIIPPLCVLKPQIEINKTEDIFIPLNVNRVNKYTTDLKLKKSTLKTKMNTLDSCMNLKCT